MKTVLRTPRVELREFNRRDLDVLADMMADEDQMSLYPRPRTRDESEAWLERNLALYRDRGYGFWLMEQKIGGDFLGYCGIRPVVIEGLEEIEMGWHTRKFYWNRGLASEAAAACQALAFARFGISRLVATIDPANGRSLRVAQKIGMQAEKKTVLGDWACVVYSAERPGLAAFATIRDTDGRVLLVRRRDIDIWESPGGTAEQHESAADAVIRETSEETGLRITAQDIAGLYWRPNKDTLVVQFLCDVTGKSPQQTDEAAEIRYFAVDRLPERLAPVVRERIEDSVTSPGIFRTQEGLGARDFLASLG